MSMKIYTRTGDAGETGLFGGGRVAKDHPRVAAYGGGCVPPLNAALGLTPVPECAIPGILASTGAGPGGSVTTGSLAAGTYRFMCLIHPWMRTTVTVG